MALFSFVLLAYNQERFIRAAAVAALSQTYRPLEIILSDDCSSDQTFAIMEELARAYRGPHAIRLNRNASNLGIAAHYNRACQLATGQCLVFAAGDDISSETRVQRIADEWKRAGRPAEAVFYSKVQRITQDGAAFPKEGDWFGERQREDPARIFLEWGGFVVGASMAVTRGIFEKYGPVADNLPCEDIPALWRGALCGHLLFIDEALVRWRVGGAGAWSAVYDRKSTPGVRLERMKRFLCERRALLDQARQDVRVGGETAELSSALSRFDQETACALSSIGGSAWRFLLRYLLRWATGERVSHALRECVVEYIRISKEMGRSRALWLMTEAVARGHGLMKRLPQSVR